MGNAEKLLARAVPLGKVTTLKKHDVGGVTCIERVAASIREYCFRDTPCALPRRVNSRGIGCPGLGPNSVCDPQRRYAYYMKLPDLAVVKPLVSAY